MNNDEENIKKTKKMPEEIGIIGEGTEIYNIATKVNSNTSQMTRDHTLAELDPNLFQNKMARFIIEQKKLVRAIHTYLIIPIEKLEKRYTDPKKAIKIHEQLKRDYQQINKILNGEADEWAIISRANKGQTIKSMLLSGQNTQTATQLEQELNPPTTTNKLMETRK